MAPLPPTRQRPMHCWRYLTCWRQRLARRRRSRSYRPAEAVTRVISERAAGQDTAGSVDLIWINGPNFIAMREKNLLFGPFVANLPNARYVDLSPEAPASLDFTVPVEGMESPWRLARFVFTYDSARVDTPPRTMAELVDWAPPGGAAGTGHRRNLRRGDGTTLGLVRCAAAELMARRRDLP